GNRTAPRHLGIGAGGKELFDRFLDGNWNVVDDELAKHSDASGPAPRLGSADRALPALLRSRAAADRDELEARFLAGDGAAREGLLAAAAASGRSHPELFRLGLNSGDGALRAAALEGLRATAEADDLPFLLRQLGIARSIAEHRALLAALERPATRDDLCRRALTIRRALLAPPIPLATIDPEVSAA